MNDGHTLFRCQIESHVNGVRKTKVMEIWTGWPGTARREAEAVEGGWQVVGVSADYGARRTT